MLGYKFHECCRGQEGTGLFCTVTQSRIGRHGSFRSQSETISKKPFSSKQISKDMLVTGTSESSEVLRRLPCTPHFCWRWGSWAVWWEGGVPGWGVQRAGSILVKEARHSWAPGSPARRRFSLSHY